MWKAHWPAVGDKEIFKPARPSKGYHRAYRMALPSVAKATKWPTYEIKFADDCITNLRIDFIPVDLGSDGMVDLHSVLITLMPDGWGYVVKHAKVTRLDVALDFPLVEMDDLLFLPQQGVTTRVWASNGTLKSYQLGKSNANCTMIYNRKAKRIDKGQAWKGKEGIRLERRLRHLQMPLSDLATLSSPFECLTPVNNVQGPPPGEEKAYQWPMFMATVEQRGLGPALALLPTKKRTVYRTHLKQHCAPWWDPVAFWQGWAASLDALKLIDPNTWS
jgi:hypothetical protein